MWKFVIIYIFSMILVEKAQYNSCCFLLWKEENYNAVVSRQNIRIRARTTLVVFCLWKEEKLQCSGFTSKHSNSFVIVFIVRRQFFCFVLFLQDKFWCFYHFLWAFCLKRKCTFHGNIYINEKLNPFSNKKMQFLCKKEEEKIIF